MHCRSTCRSRRGAAAADRPPVGGQPAAEPTSGSTRCSTTSRTRRRCSALDAEIDITVGLADALRHGRRAPAGLHPPPDLVQDPHGRLRRRGLRRPDRQRRRTPFTTTNCGALPFTPELSARIKRTGLVNEPVELSTTIAQTIDEAGLLRAQVMLPAGARRQQRGAQQQVLDGRLRGRNLPGRIDRRQRSATSPLLAEALSGRWRWSSPPRPVCPTSGIDLRGPLALKLKGTLGFTPDGPQHRRLRQPPGHPDRRVHAHLRRRPGRAGDRQPRRLRAAAADLRRQLPRPFGARRCDDRDRDRRLHRRRAGRWRRRSEEEAAGEDQARRLGSERPR